MRDILSISKALRNKEYSSVELTKEYLKRIEKSDKEIGAYITVCSEEAIKKAEEADRKIANGDKNILCGIPYAIKDSIVTKDIKTTCASNILKEYIPPYSSTVYDKLSECGAVLLGKTNMDEFAMGSSCESSFFHITKNPLDTERVPGGSSGGSCAAVAADMAIFALGSDTGGSIRQPSGFCNTYGLKPTYGSVSRHGLVSFAPALDQIGPISGNLSNVLQVLKEISGYDPMDSTSVNYTESSNKIQKIAIIREAYDSVIEKSDIDEKIKELSTNHELDFVSLDIFDDILSAYRIISCVQAFSNLARFDGIRYGHRTLSEFSNIDDYVKKNRTEGFGIEAKRRMICGAYALSDENYKEVYLKAYKIVDILKERINNILSEYDAILLPTVPCIAPKFTYENKEKIFDLCDKYNIIANLTSLPSIACGKVQLMGKMFSEKELIETMGEGEQL